MLGDSLSMKNKKWLVCVVSDASATQRGPVYDVHHSAKLLGTKMAALHGHIFRHLSNIDFWTKTVKNQVENCCVFLVVVVFFVLLKKIFFYFILIHKAFYASLVQFPYHSKCTSKMEKVCFLFF